VVFGIEKNRILQSYKKNHNGDQMAPVTFEVIVIAIITQGILVKRMNFGGISVHLLLLREYSVIEINYILFNTPPLLSF
jgi:hypothetical protein